MKKMTIKIEIYKTTNGKTYRNIENKKIVGGVYQNKTQSNKWEWSCYFGFDTVETEEDAHYALQKELAQNAKYLGIEIEFTNI